MLNTLTQIMTVKKIIIFILTLLWIIFNSQFKQIVSLETVKIRLSSNLTPALKVIILPFREHITNDSDGEQIKLRDGQPDLHTPEQEQGCCHRAVSCAMFF